MKVGFSDRITFETFISFCLSSFCWREFVTYDKFSEKLLISKGFKIFHFFAFLFFPEFKNIPKIFNYIRKLLEAKFFDEGKSTCNMLLVIFSELSCSFGFCVDISPSFGVYLYEGVPSWEFDSVSLASEVIAVLLSSDTT